MDSPITHEKIIEVLRQALKPFAEADDAKTMVLPLLFFDDGIVVHEVTREHFRAARAALETARDLYQRLQAEKEGGWQPTHRHYKGGVYRELCRGKSEGDLRKVVVYEDEARNVWVRSAYEFDGTLVIRGVSVHRFEPLNQEGGDAAAPGPASSDPSRRHVAPPASANAGTGRALAERIVNAWALPDHHGFVPPWPINPNWLLGFIDPALASEHQRGKAEGKRIGIEEAAKVADEEHALRGQYGAAEAASRIAARIRRLALNTGDHQT